ncbi:MAG TPA: efflux transporter outer membrane subunit [Dokdonella sp.]
MDARRPHRPSRAPARRGRARRRLRALALALFATALAGCATAPLPELPDDTPAAWRNAPSAAAAREPAPDLRSWWTAFDDPLLDRLVDEALAENLSIREAALRIAGARALDRRTRADYLPQAGAHTYAEPTPDSSASYFQIGFDAKWELGLFGRADGHARVTGAELALAEDDLQSARVSVVAEVVRSYVELRGAQRRLELLETLAATAARKADLVATRVRLRQAAAGELARARAEQAAAEAAPYAPRLAIETSRRKLAVLLAKNEPDAELDAPGAQPRLGALGVAAAPADLLRTRPEIRRAEHAVLKAAGELGLARAELYPRLGLGGSLTYAARVIGHTRLSDADGIVTIGPLIDIPLFDWGARRAAADARATELSASVLAYRQAVLDGVAEAETALAALERQRERVAALERGVPELERAERDAATLGRLGLADGLDRAAAADARAQAELELAQALEDRAVAFVALYKSLGGAPLPAVDAAPGDAAAADAALARGAPAERAR